MERVRQGRFEFIADQWPINKEKRTLILIHGAGMNCQFWDYQVTGLSPYANVIAINLPGRGESETEAFYSIQENAGHILDFIDENQIKNPVVCGLSMGGAVVLSLICHDKDKIKAGIVINSGARLRVNSFLLDTIKNNYTAHVESLGKFAVFSKNYTKELQARLNESIITEKESAIRDFQACNTFDVMDNLENISIPVLILTASEDTITPKKYGEHLKNAIPNGKLCCIKDAGHLSPMETPEAVNREIADFITHCTH